MNNEQSFVNCLTREGRAEEEIREAKKNRSFFKIGTKTEKPFEDYTIAFAGKLSQSVAKLQKIVEELGGKYSSTVTIHVTHMIGTEAQAKKLPKDTDEITGKGKLDLAAKVRLISFSLLSCVTRLFLLVLHHVS